MEKCMSCQYYDRKQAKAASGGAAQWGQCRRSAPMLNPVNPKSYMIEGVWPTVRDDDWCGEWKILARRVDGRVAEALNAPLISAQSVSAPRVPKPVLPASAATVASTAASTLAPSPSPGIVAGGRPGND